MGPAFSNNLPKDIKDINNVDEFKKELNILICK